MKNKTFLRRTANRYAKLGKGRKKKQVWRKPKGRDNKMREKRKGYPSVVEIGYKKAEKAKEKSLIINRIKDLDMIQENHVIILGKVGKRNKIEIVKVAKDKKIKFKNINITKFLKQVEEDQKKKKAKVEAKKIADSKKQKKKDKKKKETPKEKITEQPKQDETKSESPKDTKQEDEK